MNFNAQHKQQIDRLSEQVRSIEQTPRTPERDRLLRLLRRSLEQLGEY